MLKLQALIKKSLFPHPLENNDCIANFVDWNSSLDFPTGRGVRPPWCKLFLYSFAEKKVYQMPFVDGQCWSRHLPGKSGANSSQQPILHACLHKVKATLFISDCDTNIQKKTSFKRVAAKNLIKTKLKKENKKPQC